MNEIAKSEKSKLMGILSLVFGIVAIVLSFTPLGRGLVVILGIAAVVLGVIELDRIKRGLSDPNTKNIAIAGIVLGGVAIVLFAALGMLIRGFAMPGFDRGIMGKFNLPSIGRFGRFK